MSATSAALFNLIVANKRACSAPAMPTTDPAGFTRLWEEDFNTDVAVGSFMTVYSSKFTSQTDGTETSNGGTPGAGHGKYYHSKTLSVSNGILYGRLHSESISGTVWPLSFNISPIIHPEIGTSPENRSQVYGRWVMCWRVRNVLQYYKWVPLLWDGNVPGEVDFPEFNLNSGALLGGFIHPGDGSSQYQYSSSIDAIGDDWHITMTEVLTDNGGTISFYHNDLTTPVFTRTGNGTGVGLVSTDPHWWNWQSEPQLPLSSPSPDPATDGYIEIAWAVVWSKP